MEIKEITDLLHTIRETETPNTSVLEKWRKHYPFVITEGLIQSYPEESVAHTIAQLYNLTLGSWEYGDNGRIKVKDGAGNNGKRILISLTKEGMEFLDGINNHMLKYGWFLAEQEYTFEGMRVVFEKKFGDRYSVADLLKKPGNKFLYHITSSKIAEKISRQGFVPKSHTEEYLKTSDAFKNGDDVNGRVYFFIVKPDDSMVRTWGRVACSRTGGEPVLITVNPEFIDKNVSFFMDPRWANGVFTYEPIPPSAIYSIEECEI